jgi:hypothetical protein
MPVGKTSLTAIFGWIAPKPAKLLRQLVAYHCKVFHLRGENAFVFCEIIGLDEVVT